MNVLPALDDTVFDLSDMDPSVSPGDDFYEFANGGWRAANPVPDDYSRWAAFEEVRQSNEETLRQLLETAASEPGESGTPRHWCGLYFRAGMDTDRIEQAGLRPIRPYLERIEGIEDIADLRDVGAELLAYGVSLPIGAAVIPDFDDSTRNLIYLDQGGLGLPERDYYFREDEQSIELRRQYEAHVARMLELSGHPDASKAAEAVTALETALAEQAHTAAQRRDMDLVLNRHGRGDLPPLMPSFDIVTFMQRFGARNVDAVNVGNPEFFAAADELLADTAPETLRAYARWHLIAATASSLPSEFEEEAFRFYGQILGGQKEQKERWKRVLRAASAELGQLVAQLYVTEAFSPAAKARAETMVGNIIDSMGDAIRGLDWMSEATKAAALTKLEGFRAKLGYPDVWRDYTGLEFEDAPWVTLRLAARAFEFRRRLGELHRPVDPHEWEMGAHEVNAYYHPLRNEIVFPAGILQPPFFQADADDAVNYGGIGAVIGHEITHGFDDMGSRFDAAGTFVNWWTEEDRAEFERRAKVVVDQFSAYEPLEGLFVNGELTLGENIADLGGVTIAYQALQRALADRDREHVGGLTPEQRFFLAYARAWRSNETEEFLRLRVQTDSHSPSEYRCNGPLGNLEEFATAFGIDGAAPMMRPPEGRAKIW